MNVYICLKMYLSSKFTFYQCDSQQVAVYQHSTAEAEAQLLQMKQSIFFSM